MHFIVARPADRNVRIDYVSHRRQFVLSVGHFQFLKAQSVLDTSDNVPLTFDKKDILISSDTVDFYLCFVWFRKWIVPAVYVSSVLQGDKPPPLFTDVSKNIQITRRDLPQQFVALKAWIIYVAERYILRIVHRISDVFTPPSLGENRMLVRRQRN